jgi:hypothetical protein
MQSVVCWIIIGGIFMESLFSSNHKNAKISIILCRTPLERAGQINHFWHFKGSSLVFFLSSYSIFPSRSSAFIILLAMVWLQVAKIFVLYEKDIEKFLKRFSFCYLQNFQHLPANRRCIWYV